MSPGNAAGSGRRAGVPAEGRAGFLDEHSFDLVRAPLPDGVLVESVGIPMRDGVELAGTVFRPESGGPVPAITTSTPYGKDGYDQWDRFRDSPDGDVPGGGFFLGRLRISDHTAFEAPDPGFWVPHGYALLVVDHPGLGRSGAKPAGDPGIGSRWHDVMAWLEAQPWCTGKVGMSGVSALCATQWMAAKTPAPAQLKAIVPWEGFNETGPGGGYGGIPEIAFRAWIGRSWIGPNVNPDAPGPEPSQLEWDYDTSSIAIPALVCASFSDQELHTWDTFDAVTRMTGDPTYLYSHRRQKWGAYYGADELALQKRFLDRFLKDSGDDMADVPAVRLEVNEDRDTYKIVHAGRWPVEGTRYERLYLDATSASLLPAPPTADAAIDIAPAPAGDADNRAVFDHRFSTDTDLVGHMALTLFVEGIETSDVDLFVGVEKLDRDGNEVYFFSSSGGNANGPVTRGWLRASKRTLVAGRSTRWRPVPDLTTDRPLDPYEIARLDIPLMPSGTTFRAGETLRLVVQSWSMPGQWEGGATLKWDALRGGNARLHTGRARRARLLVPVLPA